VLLFLLVLIKDCTSVVGVKLEILFEACVDKILRASIRLYAGFWIGTLRFHEICDHSIMLWDNNHKEVEGGSIQGVVLLSSSIQGVRFLYPT
jgi:hypothetical protein